MSRTNKNYQLKLVDLLPGIRNLAKRLPQMAKSGISTLTLFSNLPYSLGTILEKNAKLYGDRPALYFEDKIYTYKSFNHQVNIYANYFIDIGIQHGQVVILFLENRPETILLTAALAKIGAVASLINPNHRKDILLHSITVKLDNYLIIGEELIEQFEEIRSNLPSKNFLFMGIEDKGTVQFPAHIINLNTASSAYPKSNPATTASVLTKDHLAYIFTSGTTGLPKASIQTHKQWLRSMNWFGEINGHYSEEDVIYIPIPFFHANAFLIGWASAFSNGAAMAMRRKFSVNEFWKDIRKYKATSFIYIGEICRYLMNAPKNELDQHHNVVKIIGNGLRPEIWSAFQKRFNIKSVYEFYAASDSNIVFTNTLNIENCVGWSPADFAIVKYDIDHDEVYRNNKGRLEKVKIGEVGLMISKVSDLFPFNGYANSKHNEGKLFRHVFKQNDQWFNTGDLMRDIGFKHAQFVDRVGDTFRWKGENVSTAEIEGIISEFDFIEMAAVYGVQIPNCDGRAGMATIKVNEKFSPERLNQFYKELLKKLPPYAIPIFVSVCDHIEVTHTQKIKKGELKKNGFEKDRHQHMLYVSLPKQNSYVFLDDKIFVAIKEGKYNF